MKPKEERSWSRLDNAAKIFPPTSSKQDPRVFRFSCELTEEVNPEALQQALNQTLAQFPGYRTVMRHGMFWYYLEATDLMPVVQEEWEPICSPIYDRNRASLLFHVTYYRCRMNLELYHVLADGTGALHFLQALVCAYLGRVHKEELGENPPQPDYDASVSEKMADSFQKYYDPKDKKNHKRANAYRIRGTRMPENRMKVVEGILPVDEVLQLARRHKTTVTVLLTALLFQSIHKEMSLRDMRRPVVLTLPVNLRNHFPSESARNFFAIMDVQVDFSRQSTELADLIPVVAEAFRTNLTPENLQRQMNSFIAIEKNIAARAAPLAIKDVAMRGAYLLSARGETATLSNVGKIDMPEAYRPYIRLFDVFTTANKIQLCMCSFENNMVLSFSDPFQRSDIEKNFFRALSAQGIAVEIVTAPQQRRGMDIVKP